MRKSVNLSLYRTPPKLHHPMKDQSAVSEPEHLLLTHNPDRQSAWRRCLQRLHPINVPHTLPQARETCFKRHMRNSYRFPPPGFSAPISGVYSGSVRLVLADFIHVFRNRISLRRSASLHLAAGRTPARGSDRELIGPLRLCEDFLSRGTRRFKRVC